MTIETEVGNLVVQTTALLDTVTNAIQVAAIDTNVQDVVTRANEAIAVDIPVAIASVAAINNMGAWANATAYTYKDVVSNGGTWYICIVPHTSSAAFVTDTATKWRVYQGLLSSDLEATTMAGLVGYDEELVYPSGSVGAELQSITGPINKIVTCYGDSFTMGVSGGVTYDQNYVSIIAAAKKWNIPIPPDFGAAGEGSTTVGNQAYGGSQISSTEQIERIMAHTTLDDDIQWILTGINDSRNLGYTGLESYRQTLMAALAWMCIPASHGERFNANSNQPGRVSRTGTGWQANTAWFNGNGYHTAVEGDSFNFTVFGDTIYIALPRDTTTTGKCDIVVDGVVVRQYDFSGASGAAQYAVAKTMGFVRITGLTREFHGVNIIKTSAANGSDYMRVDWVAGVSGNAFSHDVRGGPQVFVGNCCRLTAAAYTQDGPTWNNANNTVVHFYNAAIEECVMQLAEDGANIVLVDASLHYNPNSGDVAADGIHPSPLGHQRIAAAFLEKMDDRHIHPIDRNTNYMGGVKHPSNSSLGQMLQFGEEGSTSFFGSGGKQTILSYNIKIVGGKFFRINETLGAHQVVIGSAADSPAIYYAAPGTGEITGWDTTTALGNTAAVSSVVPALLNSWEQHGSWSLLKATKYVLGSNTRVELSGTLMNGTLGIAAFVLPVGYRPAKKFGCPVVGNGAFGFMTVDVDGNVIIESGSSLWTSLDGISFII